MIVRNTPVSLSSMAALIALVPMRPQPQTQQAGGIVVPTPLKWIGSGDSGWLV